MENKAIKLYRIMISELTLAALFYIVFLAGLTFIHVISYENCWAMTIGVILFLFLLDIATKIYEKVVI